MPIELNQEQAFYYQYHQQVNLCFILAQLKPINRQYSRLRTQVYISNK